MNRRIGIVGHRPDALLPEEPDVLSRIGWFAHAQGNTLVSGGAKGADYYGVTRLIETLGHKDTRAEVFIPFDGFNGINADNTMYVDCESLPNYDKAIEILYTVIPYKLKGFALKAHVRNMYIVLGRELDKTTALDFLVCAAAPKGDSGEVNRGTATAVKLALDLNIPVYNIRNEYGYEQWVNHTGIRL